jgi:hypothetical protein
MKRWVIQLAAVLQGLVLGALLAHAILSLAIIANGVRLFRYQGF